MEIVIKDIIAASEYSLIVSVQEIHIRKIGDAVLDIDDGNNDKMIENSYSNWCN